MASLSVAMTETGGIQGYQVIDGTSSSSTIQSSRASRSLDRPDKLISRLQLLPDTVRLVIHLLHRGHGLDAVQLP